VIAACRRPDLDSLLSSVLDNWAMRCMRLDDCRNIESTDNREVKTNYMTIPSTSSSSSSLSSSSTSMAVGED
jgi:hypothetical protein